MQSGAPAHSYSTRSRSTLPSATTLSHTFELIAEQTQRAALSPAHSVTSSEDSFDTSISSDTYLGSAEYPSVKQVFATSAYTNLLFAGGDVMEGSSLEALTQALETTTLGGKYSGGETGRACLQWRTKQDSFAIGEVCKALSHQHDVSASMLLERIKCQLKPRSEAQYVFAELTAANWWAMQQAKLHRFVTWSPNARERELALGSHLGDPEYERVVLDTFREEFESVAYYAMRKGWAAPPEPEGHDVFPIDPDNPVRINIQVNPHPAVAEQYIDLRQGIPTVVDRRGKEMTASLYVVFRVLTAFELRFGLASPREVNELKTLTQGEKSVDEFAHELEERQRTVRHIRDIDQAYVAHLFVQGLKDRNCANEIAAHMRHLTKPQITLDAMRNEVRKYNAAIEQELEVKTHRSVAAHVLKGETSVDAVVKDLDKLSMGQEHAKQAKRKSLPADHPWSPCVLGGRHVTHMNMDCRSPQHPFKKAGSNNSQQQSVMTNTTTAAAAVQASNPPKYNNAYGWGGHAQAHKQGPYAAAGVPPPPPPALPQAAGSQVLQPGDQRSRGPHAMCNYCGHREGHYGKVCWYNSPHQAKSDWAPSPRASPTALQLYNKRCRELGIHPKQPGESSSAASKPPVAAASVYNSVHMPAVPDCAAWSDLNDYGWDEWDEQPAAAGWYMAGSCLQGSKPVADNYTYAAVGTRRSNQPRSFIPPDNTVLRSISRQLDTGDDGNAGTSDVPTLNLSNIGDDVDVQVSFTFKGDKRSKLLSYLQQYSAANAPVSEVSGSALPAEAYAADALDSVSNDVAAAVPEADASFSPCMTSIMGELMRATCGAVTPDHLLSKFNQNNQSRTMYMFAGSEPSNTPCAKLKSGRLVMLSRAASDSGCVPNLITLQEASSLGLYVHRLPADQLPQVRNIEGAGASRIIGYTEPFDVVLGYGTADEVSLSAAKGFLVIDSQEATDMYGCVLGRDLLDQVSGFAIPVLQQFFYMPKLQQGDLKLAHLPIAVGNPRTAKQVASMATVVNQLSMFACVAVPADEVAAGLSSHQVDALSVKVADAPLLESASLTGWWCPRWSLPNLELPLLLSCFRNLVSLGVSAVWLLVMCFTMFAYELSWGALTYHRVCSMLSWLVDHIQLAAPWVKVRYYRLGRYHRSADGQQVKLAMLTDKHGSSCSKPKMIDIMSRQCSWKHMFRALPLQLLWLIMFLTVLSSVKVAAVRVYSQAALHSSAVANTGVDICTPLPFHAGQVLAWCVAEGLHDSSFRCCGWGPP